MLLNVKLLSTSPSSSLATSASVEAQPEESVEALKAKLERILNLGANKFSQKLVYRGKTLQDGTDLAAYDLRDGAKIHLVLKETSSTPKTLEAALTEALLKKKGVVEDEATAKRIAKIAVEKFDAKLANLSLDDVERIAKRAEEGGGQIAF